MIRLISKLDVKVEEFVIVDMIDCLCMGIMILDKQIIGGKYRKERQALIGIRKASESLLVMADKYCSSSSGHTDLALHVLKRASVKVLADELSKVFIKTKVNGVISFVLVRFYTILINTTTTNQALD